MEQVLNSMLQKPGSAVQSQIGLLPVSPPLTFLFNGLLNQGPGLSIAQPNQLCCGAKITSTHFLIARPNDRLAGLSLDRPLF